MPTNIPPVRTRITCRPGSLGQGQNRVDFVKALSIYSFLCLLGLWISPAVAGACCAKSAVFAEVHSHVQLLIHQSGTVGSYRAGAGASTFRSFAEKPNRVNASASSSPEGLVSWDCRDYSDEDADMDRKDEGEEEISCKAASEIAVRPNSRGRNRKTSRVISKSSSRPAGLIRQNPLIESRFSFTHRKIFSGVFPRPLYTLFMTRLI